MGAMVFNDKGIPIIETLEAMKRRHFNERVEVLEYLAGKNLTSRQAAKILDVPSSSIRHFIQWNGLGIKFRFPTDIGDERRAEYTRVYEERLALSQAEPRLTCKEAAEKLGITAGGLKIYSLRNSIKWKPK